MGLKLENFLPQPYKVLGLQACAMALNFSVYVLRVDIMSAGAKRNDLALQSIEGLRNVLPLSCRSHLRSYHKSRVGSYRVQVLFHSETVWRALQRLKALFPTQSI